MEEGGEEYGCGVNLVGVNLRIFLELDEWMRMGGVEGLFWSFMGCLILRMVGWLMCRYLGIYWVRGFILGNGFW